MATAIDLLIKARWVIPIRPKNTVFENYSVAVTGGKIVEVLDSTEAVKKYNAACVIDKSKNHLVMPGLINSHTHAAMNLLRGYADDKALHEWLFQHIFPIEGRVMSKEFVRDGVELACAEMIRSGTTAFNDMYFFPEEAIKTVASAGIRAACGAIVLKFPSAQAGNPADYFPQAESLMELSKKDPHFITCPIAPHAPYTVTDEQLEQIRAFSEKHNAILHVHLHETKQEVDDAIKETKERPINRLERLGCITPRMLAVHCTQLEDADIDLLASKGASVAHCPESNSKLASGYCPVPQLLAKGVNVCIGTDGSASNNDLDMWGEMRTACFLAKLHAKDATVLPAFTALEMATINGAKALGVESTLGSLEANKLADMIAVDLDTIETLPVHNPMSHLIYTSGRQNVTDVWVNGKTVMENRTLKTINMDQLKAKTKTWYDKIIKIKEELANQMQQ